MFKKTDNLVREGNPNLNKLMCNIYVFTLYVPIPFSRKRRLYDPDARMLTMTMMTICPHGWWWRWQDVGMMMMIIRITDTSNISCLNNIRKHRKQWKPVFKVFGWSDNQKAEAGEWSQQASHCEAECQSSVENLITMMVMMVMMVMMMILVKRSDILPN